MAQALVAADFDLAADIRLDLTPQVALAVAIAMLLKVLLAKMIGCLLPLGAVRLGFDPAVMASPFITTIVDALALLMYFVISKNILSL